MLVVTHPSTPQVHQELDAISLRKVDAPPAQGGAGAGTIHLAKPVVAPGGEAAGVFGAGVKYAAKAAAAAVGEAAEQEGNDADAVRDSFVPVRTGIS